MLLFRLWLVLFYEFSLFKFDLMHLYVQERLFLVSRFGVVGVLERLLFLIVRFRIVGVVNETVGLLKSGVRSACE
jgi:hypothetical protein